MMPHHHPSTSHTASGFILDAILGFIPMTLGIADINAVIQVGAGLVALVVSIVRLVFLIKKGGKE